MDAKERKAFGARVRQERKARRMSQPDLAELVGVSTGTISATERGLSVPQPSNLTRLLKELDISLNGKEPEAEPEPDPGFSYGAWFEALPTDIRSMFFTLGLYMERLGPDDRDSRIRQTMTAIVEQRL